MKYSILIAFLTFFTREKKAIAPIALLLFNCTVAHAQLKLEITPSDSKYAKMQIDCEDQTDCDAKLLKWIEKQKFFKGEWKLDAIGGIVSKVDIDLETNSELIYYFHPANFSIIQEDISQELADKEAKKIKDSQDLESVKAKILDGSAKLDDIILYIKIKEGI